MRRLLLSALVVGAVAGFGAGVAAAKLSPAEDAWAKKVVTVYNKEAGALQILQSQEEADGGEAMVAGSGKANDELTATLSIFASCPAWIKQAGKPPTARLDRTHTDMVGSCADLSAGGQDVARAIGALALQKTAAFKADLAASLKKLSAGSKLLVAAQRQLSAIGG